MKNAIRIGCIALIILSVLGLMYGSARVALLEKNQIDGITQIGDTNYESERREGVLIAVSSLATMAIGIGGLVATRKRR